MLNVKGVLSTTCYCDGAFRVNIGRFVDSVSKCALTRQLVWEYLGFRESVVHVGHAPNGIQGRPSNIIHVRSSKDETPPSLPLSFCLATSIQDSCLEAVTVSSLCTLHFYRSDFIRHWRLQRTAAKAAAHDHPHFGNAWTIYNHGHSSLAPAFRGLCSSCKYLTWMGT